MYWIATAVTYVVFLLALPVLLLHPKLRQGTAARLGFLGRNWSKTIGDGPRFWLHGASAGDVLALMPLVRELKIIRPDAQIILSTITNSGRAIAERERQAFAAITFLPFDLPGAVRRTVNHIRPDVLVLEYTELWPQLIRAAHNRNIPIVLQNGRISDANLRAYRRLFFFVGNLLTMLTLLLMRDEHEAERARKLGAKEAQIRITGNTKFDNLTATPLPAKVEELRHATALTEKDIVWAAGSTHDGEEEILLDAYCELRKAHPTLRMVIAPRYVERAEKVGHLASRRGLVVRFRSHSDTAANPKARADVLILDTIGELAACYQLASVVFVGGSFVARGGQNILEPAACGKPVLFGPYMQNFADSVQVLLGRGGIQVANPTQLKKVIADLLARPERLEELGNLAAAQVLRVRGAAARNAQLIAALPQRQPTK
ncbi:MAG: hypothetical protein A2289_24860 [Deltaproteobacteria bacterium RIFOXYA12_FULL_58_15]|nr:MAG: hypothetical protein A2289_24860 [Deltaproteobacteria bacterium RIFOXYA12_FULL_58_15]